MTYTTVLSKLYWFDLHETIGVVKACLKLVACDKSYRLNRPLYTFAQVILCVDGRVYIELWMQAHALDIDKVNLLPLSEL